MRTALATLALTLLATSAAAQERTETPPGTKVDADTIVVTGSAISDDAVAEFVKAVTVEAEGGQLAAFHAPVCPKSFGLPEAFNAVIEDRIRAVARDAGIEVADADCRVNIAVFVADDGSELIARLRAEHPSMFAGRDASDNRGLVLQDGPVRAWQVLDARGSDGRLVRRVNFVDARALPRGKVLFLPRGKVVDGVVSSKLTRPLRQDLALSYVVIDVGATDGLSLAQIGDHAAMRALAQTDPEAAAATGQPTILSLFADRGAGRSPVEAITDWDKAFLKSLYETRRTVSAGLQRSSMTRIAREALAAGEPESDDTD
ncbi:hypothetical protein [Sphingosinicella humi]|uniref:DUF2927 domain-containing protein n=1 Tax=Allosphingosinicella humi TaxID=2068657 RepID=A0A2U2J0R9_9SPHN|nr:hypothetical protein [Sphingosinicella humi]PWG01934.1 hypothetical protein DF286_02905 [Sphingosinicella humi]